MNRNPLNLGKPERLFVGIAGLLGVFLANWSGKFIHYFMPIGRDMVVTWGAFRISGNLLLAGVFALIIYRMLKIFRQTGFTPKRILSIVVCVVFVLFIIVVNAWRYTAVMNFNQYLETTNADINKSISNKLNQDLPSEKKSKLSFLHAKSAFTDDGRIVEYLSPDGQSVKFIPTAEDQSNRNMILFQQTQSASEKIIATTISLLWSLALLGAFTSAFLVKKPEANA